MSEKHEGWFVDVDEDADPRWPWVACVQIDMCCFPIEAWHTTEKEALRFARKLAALGMMDE